MTATLGHDHLLQGICQFFVVSPASETLADLLQRLFQGGHDIKIEKFEEKKRRKKTKVFLRVCLLDPAPGKLGMSPPDSDLGLLESKRSLATTTGRQEEEDVGEERKEKEKKGGN